MNQSQFLPRPTLIQKSRNNNLPYAKYISLDLAEPHHFNLRFHRFYDETLKRLLKQIPGMAFNLEIRAW